MQTIHIGPDDMLHLSWSQLRHREGICGRRKLRDDVGWNDTIETGFQDIVQNRPRYYYIKFPLSNTGKKKENKDRMERKTNLLTLSNHLLYAQSSALNWRLLDLLYERAQEGQPGSLRRIISVLNQFKIA